MDVVWEFVKGLGALVGLATGAFVLWERFFRETPWAFIVSAPLTRGSINTVARLRVVNRSVRPILVTWKSGDNTSALRIVKNRSTRAVVAALLEGERHHVVGGEETIDLDLMMPDRLAEIDPDNILEAELYWSFAQPIIWQRPRRLSIRIRKAALLQLLNDDEWADEGS